MEILSHNAQATRTLLEGHFRCFCVDGRVELVGYSDSGRAGDAGSRKSQSSGKIFEGGGLLNSFSRRQSGIATSSSPAEFFAAAAFAEHLAHPHSPGRHAKIKLDPSAARRIANREGVGRVCSWKQRLWCHPQAVRRGLIELQQVPPDDNLADLGTTLRVGPPREVANWLLDCPHQLG